MLSDDLIISLAHILVVCLVSNEKKKTLMVEIHLVESYLMTKKKTEISLLRL